MAGDISHLASTLNLTSERIVLNIEAYSYELLDKNIPLSTLLEKTLTKIEQNVPSTKCSILLLDKDGKHLRHCAAPSLPDSYNMVIDGLEIGPNAGSCGTAAYNNEQVIVSNTLKDVRWKQFRDLARKYNLLSCYSTPIVSSRGEVLGTFANYKSKAVKPDNNELQLINDLTLIIGNLIERKKISAQYELSEKRYRDIFDSANDGIFIIDQDTYNILEANRKALQLVGCTNEEISGMHISFLHAHQMDKIASFLSEITEKGNSKRDDLSCSTKNGVIPVEASGSLIKLIDKQCFMIIIRDMSDFRQFEQTMFNLAYGVSASTGKQFFHILVDHLCNTLSADYVLIGRLNQYKNMVETLAISDHGKQAENFTYELKGTPCENVISDKKMCIYHDQVQKLFPSDQLLDEFNIRSYAAVPLLNSGQNVIGIMVALFQQPIKKEKYVEQSISILAARATAEMERIESEHALDTIANNAPIMISYADSSERYVYINKSFAHNYFHKDSDEMVHIVGKKIVEVLGKKQYRKIERYLKSAYEGNTVKFEYMLVNENGDEISYEVTYVPNFDVLLNVQGIYMISMDITDRHEKDRLSKQLSYQATHDSLTGLANRFDFERKLQKLLDTKNGNSNHALCYLDLDQFKVINDTCGHAAGDHLLMQLSEKIMAKVRKQDVLARLGGDEFGVLMEKCSVEQAERVANDLLNLIHDHEFIWQNEIHQVDVSIGLVPIYDDFITVADVLSAADTACYTAKDAGRNRIHIYDAEDEAVQKRHGEMQWITKIKKALAQGQLCLYIQPIVALNDVPDKNSNHYEILVRMLGDDGAIIPPSTFLPAAERYNLSTKIDRWVVNHTIKWLKEQKKEGQELSKVSINLSGHTLSDLEFMEYLSNKISSVDINPAVFCFEITETAAISNLSVATHFINTLKFIGCQFALDDFGSGLSSLNYLKNLPVDYLKIDGSFVRDIVDNPIDHAMVNSINQIGQVMGKKTIAEFVENEKVLNRLKTIGVDYVQGYHVGKPEPMYRVSA